jgi:hypothetical protein
LLVLPLSFSDVRSGLQKSLADFVPLVTSLLLDIIEMLAHTIFKFLLFLSNVGLITYLAGCFVYDTHFPAFSIVGTFTINFLCAVAVAGSVQP